MRVVLEIIRVSPPEGRATTDDGPAVPFSGWIDLLRVLVEALEGPPPPADGQPPDA